jgi:3D (Asp-Asp-Asp) domain-containing protein
VALAGPVVTPTAINGNPLTIYVGPQGQSQAVVACDSPPCPGIYFPGTPGGDTLGDAGFFLAFPDALTNPMNEDGHVFGFRGDAGPSGLTEYSNVSQGPVTGDGSAGNPLTQVTSYATAAAAPRVLVTETTTYVNGAHQFTTKWQVSNNEAATIKYNAFAAADFLFEGDDRGTGVFTVGPPRFIGGTNVDSGQSGGFQETNADSSPNWSHYQELPYPDVWRDVVQAAADDPPAQFDDTVNPDDVDNAGGVEWDNTSTGLNPGDSATYELVSRVTVPAALQLNPTNGGAPQGVPINITATAIDSDGNPYAGKTLHFDTTGVNPASGNTTLNGSGQAVITDPGTNAGGDTIAAFVDFNNDGVREAAEPQASALATFVDHIAPTCKVSVKGDRPGGGGGAGNALVISVNCNETATLSVRSSLLLPTAHHSSVGAAKKHKKKKRQRAIKLPRTTATITPGHAVPVNIKVPASIAHKYAGRKLTAKFVITVKDAIGNHKTIKKTKKIKIAKPKHRKHKKH